MTSAAELMALTFLSNFFWSKLLEEDRPFCPLYNIPLAPSDDEKDPVRLTDKFPTPDLDSLCNAKLLADPTPVATLWIPLASTSLVLPMALTCSEMMASRTAKGLKFIIPSHTMKIVWERADTSAFMDVAVIRKVQWTLSK